MGLRLACLIALHVALSRAIAPSDPAVLSPFDADDDDLIPGAVQLGKVKNYPEITDVDELPEWLSVKKFPQFEGLLNECIDEDGDSRIGLWKIGKQHAEKFVSCFDLDRGIPLWTAHMLSKKSLSGHPAKRPAVEPWDTIEGMTGFTGRTFRSFQSFGMDRGHLVPNSDFIDRDDKLSTFVVVNRAPQLDRFNRIMWRNVENQIRVTVKRFRADEELLVFTVMGALSADTTKENGGNRFQTTVPTNFRKIMYRFYKGKFEDEDGEGITCASGRNMYTTASSAKLFYETRQKPEIGQGGECLDEMKGSVDQRWIKLFPEVGAFGPRTTSLLGGNGLESAPPGFATRINGFLKRDRPAGPVCNRFMKFDFFIYQDYESNRYPDLKFLFNSNYQRLCPMACSEVEVRQADIEPCVGGTQCDVDAGRDGGQLQEALQVVKTQLELCVAHDGGDKECQLPRQISPELYGPLGLDGEESRDYLWDNMSGTAEYKCSRKDREGKKDVSYVYTRPYTRK
eukprot:TRINITY_DN3957_c0_g1_i2.p1 TRINITY_DN3957_c0_g1~~TRINITY_DN3957_c0_g1_i2.p1  ORF type:complete len:511 (+),score=75.61 TRINITY_DN3957_c0_g1_i2:45-1577(+)